MSRDAAAPVRFGVLGCGDIAWRNTLPALARAGLALTAVASRDAARAARFAQRFDAEAVVGYEALLARRDVDAVYVAVPTGLHHEWARRALLAGKHVLVEKPLAASAAQAEDLVALAAKQQRWLDDGFMFPYHSQHAAVRRLVEEGRVGELRQADIVFGIPPRPAHDVRYRPELGGGALLDVGVYPLRAAALLLGPQLRLLGAVLRIDPALGVDLGGSALLCSASGIPVHVAFSFESAYRSRYALWGSSGRVSLDRAFTPPPQFRPVVRLQTGDGVVELPLEHDDQFANRLRAFVGAVRDGGDTEAHGAELVRQAALVDQVRDTAYRVTI